MHIWFAILHRKTSKNFGNSFCNKSSLMTLFIPVVSRDRQVHSKVLPVFGISPSLQKLFKFRNGMKLIFLVLSSRLFCNCAVIILFKLKLFEDLY